ncbi:hypothetical protein QZJ86_14020 [Methylomonas montana]|uniref:hypothetical protein n=1 Tax=Methylomonas montana TaxID=3058963 RepID=UPI00265A8893|nr:hypothetical protein [Methylomonas montana]WKJ89135.1 hypothetical protein QZJ86_14020 [Methylomonas montana]
MEQTLLLLEKRVPPPQRVPIKDGFVYRYVERTIHQALIQKLARVISGLHAARLLLQRGFFQEQAALQRMLDEFHEDISMLAYACIYSDITALHEDYLAAFYEEEFDNENAIEATQKRPMIPRRKIRAYLAKIEGAALDQSRGIELSRTVSKAYSGYVHGASPHIMDMYGGRPSQFLVTGMLGTEREEEHSEDLWNYFYRGIISFALVAKAFGDDQLFDQIRNYRDEFEKQSGKSYA